MEGESLFSSRYFTYVSLLTIGYGDFYPQDNSAKPVFVLWSLIALPTLTVLIGSVGGVINEGVNTITLWISDHLPEKSGALSAMKGTYILELFFPVSFQNLGSKTKCGSQTLLLLLDLPRNFGSLPLL